VHVVDDKASIAEAAALKKAEALKAKEIKKALGKIYREGVKKLIGICVEKMPGTLFDKFYVDELVKKFPLKD